MIDAFVRRWWPNRHILTFWSDKQRPVVDIALARGNHRWEIPLNDHEQESDFATNEDVWPLLEHSASRMTTSRSTSMRSTGTTSAPPIAGGTGGSSCSATPDT